MYVSLLFDVEDLVSAHADGDAMAVAELVREEGFRATFCIVGERVRQWRRRGRTDVVASFQAHDLGFHTDLHSIHPTVVEYLADKGWEDGVEEVIRREATGVEAFREVFDRMPSCWGGPGNTWGPQVNEAMGRLGIPAVVYAHTRVAQGDVHRFCGTLAYPSGVSMRDGEYHEPDRLGSNMESVLLELERRASAGAQWTELFMGHPSRIFHHEFWDGPNFAHGRNPPESEWVAPKRKSSADADAALGGLRATLRGLRGAAGVELRTIGEMNALFEHARSEELSAEELAWSGAATESSLAGMSTWPILPPDIDTTRIRELTRERIRTLRRLRLR